MEKDFSKKNCLADNERYADLINGLLLEGEQQVKAEDLQDMDTQRVGLLAWLGKHRGNYRLLYRDLVRKAAIGVNFLVVGVENQELVHYWMPVRDMSYDAAEYDRQVRRIRKQVRKTQRLSRAEWLSGFRKTDRLYPCITLVLYYGENWDGARSLHELLDFTDIPAKLRTYINDYPIHVFEIRKLKDMTVFKTDLKQIFEFIKYSSDKRKLRHLVQNDPAYQELDEDAYDMAVQYTGATELIVVKKDYENGGKVNMCKALTEMLADERQEGIEEGIERGIEQGLEQGIEQGIERGIEQGIEKTLFSLVKKGVISEAQAAEELGVSIGELQRHFFNKFFKNS